MSEQPTSLDTFVEELITTRGTPNLSPAAHDDMRNDLLEQLEERINLSILEALPSEALENFQDLLATLPDDEAIHDFVHQHIPNIGEVIAAELIRFRKEYLGG